MSDSNIPLIDIKPGYEPIAGELESAVMEVMRSGKYILGPKVQEAEKLIAGYCGAEFGVGVASGTDALVIALKAFHFNPGDKVLTTPFTFIATAECINEADCAPVFCDIDPVTYNIDPAAVEEKLCDDADIMAVIPVHLYGQAADMDDLTGIIKHHAPTVIIEDAAQAFGARCVVNGKDSVLGGIGDIGCHSFFPTKNLSTAGDGGMIVTSNEALAKTSTILRAHGANPKYHHSTLGYNSRLDSIHAAVVCVKLKYVDQWITMRRERAENYKKIFHQALDSTDVKVLEAGSRSMLALDDADKFLVLPGQGKGRTHTYNSFNICIPRRNELQAFLNQKGISSMIYYPIPLHLQEVYKPLGYKPGDMPVAEWVSNHVLALPFYPEIPDGSLERVVAAVKDFLVK